MEANDDLAPGQKTVLILQLAQLLPHDDTGILKNIIHGTPVRKQATSKGSQRVLMLQKKPHEVCFDQC